MGRKKRKTCVIISGSIMSNIGKGIFTASLAALHKKPRLMKIDPYLNLHAGYFNPQEHGEVYVTKDGREADLDLGYYEKFLQKPLVGDNVLTGGKINYISFKMGLTMKGKTCRLRNVVEEVFKRYFLPHDFIISELGGTIDDEEYYWLPDLLDYLHSYFEVIHIHLMPVISNVTKEVKSKPIQNSLKYLKSLSMPVDLVVLRCKKISKVNREYLLGKLSHVRDKIMFLTNYDHVYLITVFLNKVLDVPQLQPYRKDNVPQFFKNIKRWASEKRQVKKVLLINKYSDDTQVYWHLIDAIRIQFLALSNKYKLKIENHYTGAKLDLNLLRKIRNADAVILPGGFGQRGWLCYQIIFWLTLRIPGKKILGICWGKQAITCCLLRMHGWLHPETQEFNPEGQVYKLGKLRIGDKQLINDKGQSIHRRFRNRYHLSTDASEYLSRFVNVTSVDQNNLIHSYNYKNRIFACQFHPEFYYDYKDTDRTIKDWVLSIVGLNKNK